MRVPVSWLREFVDIPEDSTAEDIQAALVRVGLEEEAVHRAELSGPIVVGQVLEFVDESHNNGKTIRWCQVDVGEAEPRGIVCGAHNFHVGDKVVVSLPGAVLPGPFPISARRTYGHVSDGMIASARELGLGDEHDGILRLVEIGLDPEVGTDAVRLLGLDDYAFEVNVTPDRGYALSLRGIAREYSNSTGAAFRDPALAPSVTAIVATPTTETYPVEVDDQAPVRGRIGCSVFVTRVVTGIDATRPTPAWMVTRLRLAGVRSISLAVDITNYVMFELGQPIHGYDLDKLTGGITVRRATAGEKLVTLDDQTRTLHPEDLLITDGSGPIGLAGVMGGAATEISDATTSVLIEAANFDPVSIARTARRQKLPSEASKRFERGVDPNVAEAAAARVAELLIELGGGTLAPTGSVLFTAASAVPITLRDGFIGVDHGRRLHRRRGARSRSRRSAARSSGSSPRWLSVLRAGAPISATSRPSPKRSPASSATTASPRCFPLPRPGAASPASRSCVALPPTCWPPTAPPRCRRIRSSPKRRTAGSRATPLPCAWRIRWMAKNRCSGAPCCPGS